MASPIRPGSRSTDTAIAEVSIEEVYRCYLAFHDLALGLHRADLAHMLVLCEPLSVAGEAPMIAASIAAAASLTIEPVPAAVRHSTRSGAIDFTVNNLDEALRALKNEIRKGLSIAICLDGNQYQILLHMVERGVQPDVVCSAGPVRLEVRPFLERGARLVDPNWASLAADQVATTWSVPDLPGKWLPLVDEIVAGCLPPEDHLRRTWLKRAPPLPGPRHARETVSAIDQRRSTAHRRSIPRRDPAPSVDGLRVEFKAKNSDAIFARQLEPALVGGHICKARSSTHSSLMPMPLFAEQSRRLSMPRPLFRAAADRVRSLPDSLSALVPTTNSERWMLRKYAINAASLSCGGILASTRQTQSASCCRSARYGSMNLGHSAEMDFEIFA